MCSGSSVRQAAARCGRDMAGTGSRLASAAARACGTAGCRACGPDGAGALSRLSFTRGGRTRLRKIPAGSRAGALLVPGGEHLRPDYQPGDDIDEDEQEYNFPDGLVIGRGGAGNERTSEREKDGRDEPPCAPRDCLA
jgi:hypothetical protein